MYGGLTYIENTQKTNDIVYLKTAKNNRQSVRVAIFRA